MRKSVYYISFLLLLVIFAGCSSETDIDTPVKNEVLIRLIPQGNLTKVVDEDNLESEQTIKNLTVLFTEPSSNVITHKHVNSGFTSVDDYKVVSIPLEPSELQSKDIYVITNYGNASFNSISTLDELAQMTTPAVNKANNLKPENGFCMYGKTLDFDFANATGPAIVYAVRTCAKYRINLTFPDDPALSTDNSFVITNAANYTYIVDNTGFTIPSNAYFDFASAITLQPASDGSFTNLAYVYEADEDPKIYLYTHIDGSTAAQEYSADLPMPARNYLYDILIKVYKDDSTTKSVDADIVNTSKGYTYSTEVKVYDENGRLVEQD